MDYQYIVLAIIVVAVFCFGFKVGWFLANVSDDKNYKTEIANTLKDLYCFECEIEMPAKEKKGRLFCSNCGLSHGQI